jgi:hypothetical protein
MRGPAPASRSKQWRVVSTVSPERPRRRPVRPCLVCLREFANNNGSESIWVVALLGRGRLPLCSARRTCPRVSRPGYSRHRPPRPVRRDGIDDGSGTRCGVYGIRPARRSIAPSLNVSASVTSDDSERWLLAGANRRVASLKYFNRQDRACQRATPSGPPAKVEGSRTFTRGLPLQ